MVRGRARFINRRARAGIGAAFSASIAKPAAALARHEGRALLGRDDRVDIFEHAARARMETVQQTNGPCPAIAPLNRRVAGAPVRRSGAASAQGQTPAMPPPAIKTGADMRPQISRNTVSPAPCSRMSKRYCPAPTRLAIKVSTLGRCSMRAKSGSALLSSSSK